MMRIVHGFHYSTVPQNRFSPNVHKFVMSGVHKKMMTSVDYFDSSSMEEEHLLRWVYQSSLLNVDCYMMILNNNKNIKHYNWQRSRMCLKGGDKWRMKIHCKDIKIETSIQNSSMNPVLGQIFHTQEIQVPFLSFYFYFYFYFNISKKHYRNNFNLHQFYIVQLQSESSIFVL